MKKGLLIFDLDGTLADTIESIRAAVNMTFAAHGMPQRSYEEIRLAIGNGARELIRRSVPGAVAQDPALTEEIFQEYDRNYGLTYDRVEHCYDGISESLATLHERGYTLAVLSNKQDLYVRRLVEKLFPAGLIAYAAGQTDLPRKPDPTVPKMIAAKLGFACSQAAFIGDSDVDVRTAQNAGMLSVGCEWGYRGRQVLEEAGAQKILRTPWELTGVFL